MESISTPRSVGTYFRPSERTFAFTLTCPHPMSRVIKPVSHQLSKVIRYLVSTLGVDICYTETKSRYQLQSIPDLAPIRFLEYCARNTIQLGDKSNSSTPVENWGKCLMVQAVPHLQIQIDLVFCDGFGNTIVESAWQLQRKNSS
jgi:hypothetical protein